MLLASWFLDSEANKEFTTSCFTLDLGTDGSGFKTAILECQNIPAQSHSGYFMHLFKVVVIFFNRLSDWCCMQIASVILVLRFHCVCGVMLYQFISCCYISRAPSSFNSIHPSAPLPAPAPKPPYWSCHYSPFEFNSAEVLKTSSKSSSLTALTLPPTLLHHCVQVYPRVKQREKHRQRVDLCCRPTCEACKVNLYAVTAKKHYMHNFILHLVLFISQTKWSDSQKDVFLLLNFANRWSQIY